MEGHWIWFFSDEDVTDSFWGPNLPNTNAGNTDDCGMMVVEHDNFWWEDSGCLVSEVQHKIVATICQYDSSAGSTTATTPGTTTITVTTTETEFTTSATTVTSTMYTTTATCHPGWAEFEGHCYQFNSTVSNWADAENDCSVKGGHLASIHSRAEENFIYGLSGAHPQMWLGGTDTVSEVFTVITLKLLRQKSFQNSLLNNIILEIRKFSKQNL
jgi:hypothetical protein